MNLRYSKIGFRLFPLALLSALLIIGCSHQGVRPELESRKFSREIGLAGREVSVPLSRDEILDFASRLGAPDLASSLEWPEATSLAAPGDHMRRVSCPTTQTNFFVVF